MFRSIRRRGAKIAYVGRAAAASKARQQGSKMSRVTLFHAACGEDLSRHQPSIVSEGKGRAGVGKQIDEACDSSSAMADQLVARSAESPSHCRRRRSATTS